MSTHETRTDAELLAATPSDPEAFATFYRRHVQAVIAYVARRAPAADVGDLASEVFANALVHRRRFDPTRGSGGAWLIGIANHKIGDARRRGVVQLKLYNRLGGSRVAAAPAIDNVAAAELLETLPDDQRRAVSLRVLSDRSYDQIATDEAVSEQVARKRVSRGLAALRSRMQEGEQ
jgi:RNA polymerase sigma-70 factor (ECF subfamily)